MLRKNRTAPYKSIRLATAASRRLLTFMANGGSVDRLTAMAEMGIQNLTARISELRDCGIFPSSLVSHRPGGTRRTRYYISYYVCRSLKEQGVLRLDHLGKYRVALR